MAQISNEIEQDPNWARAVTISKQYAVSTYPATWVLNFINEWNAAVARLRRQEREMSYADFDRYVKNYGLWLDAEYDDFFHKGLERAARIVKRGGVDA